MLAQTRQLRLRLSQFVDGLFYGAAVLFAYWLRSTFPWWDLPELEDVRKYLWLTPIVIVLGPAMLAAEDLYRRPSLAGNWHLALRITRASTYLVLALILFLFLAREHFARSVILLVGGFGGILVFLRHVVAGWYGTKTAHRSRRRLLWIGLPAETTAFAAALSHQESQSLQTVGSLDPRTQSPEDLSRMLHDRAVNLVVVCMAGLDQSRLNPLLWRCTREGVETVLRIGLPQSGPGGLIVDQLGGEPVFYYRAQAASPLQLLIKQLTDYALGTALLLASAPLFAAIALLVRLSSPGPVFYRQTRAGLNGRPFTLYKFRSMQQDADRRQSELAHRNEMKGPVFKVTDDPRVTPIGRWLRRHSLDELPQLLNVIRGEMSLVGPRPLPVDEVRRIEDDAQRRRLSVRPGLTCLWQISGRNDIASFDEWVALDLAYIDRWSLAEDFRILLATIPVVLLGRGGR